MSIAGDTQPRVPGFNSYSETVLSMRKAGITIPVVNSGAGAGPLSTSSLVNISAATNINGSFEISTPFDRILIGATGQVIIGNNIPATSGASSIYIGNSARITGGGIGGDHVAIGTSATIATGGATIYRAVAIGQGATASTTDATSIRGTCSSSNGIAIRGTVNTGATNSIAIGVSSSVAASSTGATAIGDSASAGANNAVAIRGTSSATDGIAIRGTVNTGATNSIAIGNGSSVAASSTGAIAIGASAAANANAAVAIGGTANVFGGIAISGTVAANSFNSIVVGKGSSVSANCVEAIAIGSECVANESNTIVLGGGASVNHRGSVCIGYGCLSDFSGQYSLVSGGFTFGSTTVSSSTIPMWMTTTTDTPTNLATSTGVYTTTPTGTLICTNNSTYIFEVDIVAKAASNAGAAAYNLKFAFDRQGSAATVEISALSKTILYTRGTTTGWDVTATANTTTGVPDITVTGAAGTTIRWVGNVKMTKVAH